MCLLKWGKIKPALGILRELPRVEGNPHLFPGLIEGAPVVNISKPWLRIVRAAKIENIRLHDLRRTVGSWMAQAGKLLTPHWSGLKS